MANEYSQSIPLTEHDQFKDHQPQAMQPPAYAQQPRPAPHWAAAPQYAAASSQMSNNNTVVVANQPTSPPPVTVHQSSLQPSQTTLIMSLVLLTVCSLLCNFPALFCLIPGVVFAVVGFNLSHSRDKKQSAGGLNGVSMCCSVTAIFTYVVTVVCLILYFSLAYGLRRYPYNYPY